MERAGVTEAPIVPYEATAALSMLLLKNHGIVSVRFTGIPPGTAAMMVKFIPPETLDALGGAERNAQALDASLDELAGLMTDEDALRALVLGSGAMHRRSARRASAASTASGSARRSSQQSIGSR